MDPVEDPPSPGAETRDYLNQTLVVPTQDDRFQQLELFVFLVDLPAAPGSSVQARRLP